MAGKPAAPASERRRHAHWDKVVSAAYLRMLDNTQAQAAAAVGRSERTIREWESDAELWEAARAEARSRWLNDAEDAARMAVLGSLKMGNAELGKWILERVDDKLQPPTQRLKVSRDDLEKMSDEELAALAAGTVPK